MNKETEVLHVKISLDSDAEPRRREPRTDVSAGVPVRQLGQSAVEARLLNISSRGFMAETRAHIDPGARLWLLLPGAGRVNALVRWSRNGRIGGELTEPIDPLAVLHAVGETALS